MDKENLVILREPRARNVCSPPRPLGLDRRVGRRDELARVVLVDGAAPPRTIRGRLARERPRRRGRGRRGMAVDPVGFCRRSRRAAGPPRILRRRGRGRFRGLAASERLRRRVGALPCPPANAAQDFLVQHRHTKERNTHRAVWGPSAEEVGMGVREIRGADMWGLKFRWDASFAQG